MISEKDGREELIDARTSDAIALAVRFNAPIYTYETILDKAGIYLKLEDDMTAEDSEFESDEFVAELISDTSSEIAQDKTLKELYQELDAAVANENYELAAKIRDEISKRS